MTDDQQNPQEQSREHWPSGLNADGTPNWPAIEAGLNAPFEADQVKSYSGEEGMSFDYIDARDCARRLDEVVGKWNWEYQPVVVTETVPDRNYDGVPIPGSFHQRQAVQGTIYIFGIRKGDFGYPNNEVGAVAPDRDKETRQPTGTYHRIDSEEPLKEANSDALKRAGVLWGIGSHLYDAARAKRGSGAVRAISDAQRKYVEGLLEQEGFPMLNADNLKLTGGKTGTASRLIEELKSKGRNARVCHPDTGELVPLTSLVGKPQPTPETHQPAATSAPPADGDDAPASAIQIESIQKMAAALGVHENPQALTSKQAVYRITQLNEMMAARRRGASSARTQ